MTKRKKTKKSNVVPMTKNNKANQKAKWEELDNIHVECEALFVSAIQVMPLLKSKEAVAKAKDPKRILDEAVVLEKDLKTFSDSLKDIKSTYDGKTGTIETDKELIECITIGERYQQWMMSYQQVVVPVVYSLLNNFANQTIDLGSTEEPEAQDSKEVEPESDNKE